MSIVENVGKYSPVGDSILYALIITDGDGNAVHWTPSAERIFGYASAEVLGRSVRDLIFPKRYIASYDEALRALREAGHEAPVEKVIELAASRRDGIEFPAELVVSSYLANGTRFVSTVVRDIDERNCSEDERTVVLELLGHLNEATNRDELLKTLLPLFKRWSGCEAVGIRLRDGEDYPYFETTGFPDRFVRPENYLCSYNEHGELLRDEQGRPTVECMCGNILRGRVDPAKSFFTTEGAFWSNCTTELLATTTDADRQTRTRNRCHSEGYESVALIPLRAGAETFGLLQLNDKRRDRFTPRMIAVFARMCRYIANLLAKMETEKRLRESERCHRARLDNMLEGCQIIGFDWRYVYVNDAVARHGRRPKESYVGREMMEIYPGIEKTEVFRHLRRCMEERIPHRMLNEFRYPDGSIGWFDLSIQPASEGIFVLSIDMTAHKRSEEERQISEEKYRTYVENAPEGIFIVDAQGRFIDVNEVACQMTGYTRDEMMNLAIRDLTSPASPSDAGETFNLLKTEGRLFEDGILRKKDGSDIFISMKAVALSTDRYMAFCSDISDLKKTEQKLDESHRAMTALIGNLPGVVYSCKNDQNWTMNFISDGCRDLTGYSSDDLVGNRQLSFGELVHREDREKVWESIQRAIEKKQQFIIEYRITAADGTEKWVWERGIGVRDAAGNLIAIEGFISDITEQKRLESQYFQSQKMESIGRLAGGIAHDFNNLLTVIGGFSEMVYDSLGEKDPLRNDVSEIRKAADVASALTMQLLAFSRKQILSPKVVDLNKVVEFSEKMLRRIIGEDIDFVFLPNDNICKTVIDPAQIDQILINLAVNSRDAMPKGGKLTIETMNVFLDGKTCLSCGDPIAGEYVLLAVSDNGAGITAGVLDRIFEPFFTTKELGKGTGLGLSTVHGIVHQSRGHINVYSEPGRGTTFKVYLPAVREATEDTVAPAESEFLNGHETVLLVEDQDVVRNLVKKIMRGYGYHVIEAQHGEEALAVCAEFNGNIDLLLTDVVMPNLGGRQLYDRLTGRYPDMKALYMSGYTENAIAHHGVLDKGINFIQKPFRPQELASKVRQVLDSR